MVIYNIIQMSYLFTFQYRSHCLLANLNPGRQFSWNELGTRPFGYRAFWCCRCHAGRFAFQHFFVVFLQKFCFVVMLFYAETINIYHRPIENQILTRRRKKPLIDQFIPEPFLKYFLISHFHLTYLRSFFESFFVSYLDF